MHSMSHSQNIIEIDNISFSYGENPVLENINLNIHLGDFLGIVGPNGGGKSTLLKVILGLLKPSAGSVRLFGIDVNNFKDWNKIGYVPQKVTNFDVNFPATVEEVVAMGRFAVRGLFRPLTSVDKSIVCESLRQVELFDYKDRLIGKLSTGQQQRVFIARALAQKPQVIILDEPTVGIDNQTQKDFYSLLQTLNRKLDLTLIMVSHDLDAIAHEVTEVACINRILACHIPPSKFFGSDYLKQVYGENVKFMQHQHG